jgi:hypothetical protein
LPGYNPECSHSGRLFGLCQSGRVDAMWLARVSAALTLGILLAAAGCSAAQPNPAESAVPPTASDQRLESTLRCQDAWSGSVASTPEAPKAFGVSSVAWLGSPPNYSWPIADTTDGYAYTANGGKNYGAWKTPITVEAGMGERVISIDSPRTPPSSSPPRRTGNPTKLCVRASSNCQILTPSRPAPTI